MKVLSRVRSSFTELGPFAGLHPLALAAVATGLFIALTGADLGPMAPLVVSLGVYAMVFGLAVEMAIGLRLVLRWLCRRRDGQADEGQSR